MVEMDVFQDGGPVGRCTAEQAGLYTVFSCRCTPREPEICRLILHGGTGDYDLGVLTPEAGGFSLRTRVAAGKLPERPWSLAIRPGQQPRGMFVPLRPEEPFGYLHRLEGARLTTRDGQIGVILY